MIKKLKDNFLLIILIVLFIYKMFFAPPCSAGTDTVDDNYTVIEQSEVLPNQE